MAATITALVTLLSSFTAEKNHLWSNNRLVQRHSNIRNSSTFAWELQENLVCGKQENKQRYAKHIFERCKMPCQTVPCNWVRPDPGFWELHTHSHWLFWTCSTFIICYRCWHGIFCYEWWHGHSKSLQIVIGHHVLIAAAVVVVFDRHQQRHAWV